MKLKKIFESIAAVVTVALLNLALTSCRGSDPEPQTTSDPTPSLLGTWTCLLGDEGYFTCTFTGDGTSGTFLYEVNEKGKVEKESMNYTYAGGYIIFYEGNFSKTVKVISLTSNTLVLKDFPDDGNCTFTKSGGAAPVTQTSSIVGTWKHTFEDGYDLLTFYKDGTGVYSQYENGKWDDDPQPFTYTYSANVIRFFFKYDGEEAVRVKSLTSTNLILEGWDKETAIFIKQ